MPTSRRKRRLFVLNPTLIVFVEYSFSHVPLPYNKFNVNLKGCSQIIEIGTVEDSKWERKFVLWPTISISRREFDTGRVNLDPPMMCADWPVASSLTLFKIQTIDKLKP